MSDTKRKFGKLNYSNWKFKMELLSRKKNLWKSFIEGSCPQVKINDSGITTNIKEITEQEGKDGEARGTIGLLIMDD